MNSKMKVPKHVAIIMDGNSRWAKQKKLPKLYGYKKGIEAAQIVIETCIELDIKFLTLYAFSLENWQRPKDEVSSLMNIFKNYLKEDIEKLIKKNVRIIFIGNHLKLDKEIKVLMETIEYKSSINDFYLVIAISYGGRDQILRAFLKMVKQQDIKNLNLSECEKLFERAINPYKIPNPDLLIRTSGEKRISNFLLWQIAYTEFYFINKNWPDFNKKDLIEAIVDFNKRERKYGK